MIETLNFINGQFVPAQSGKVLDNYQPDKGTKLGTLPDSDAADVEAAIAAAKAAAPGWANLSPLKRAEYMYKIADLVERNMEALATAESRDNGKPIQLSKTTDIPRVITNFRFFAGQILHTEEVAVEMADKVGLGYVLRRPCGVAALVTPWNYPLYLATWKLAPAMAAGNTCVLKPSEMTPVTIGMLCEIFQEVGLPAGVVNVVHGLGAKVGNALVSHPGINCISFTGGTATGRSIALSAPLVKKSFELGGKNASIVFADCNLQEAVEGCARASFFNQGQVCHCNARVLVQRSIYNEFLEKFVAAAKASKVGPSLDPSSTMGPLISKGHLERVKSFLAVAEEDGGRILCGGHREPVTGLPDEHKGGYWLRPTVVADLPNTARCNQQEIFGPITTIQPFDDEKDALAKANGTAYGLGCSIWTDNIKRGHRVAGEIQVGTVWINSWLLRDWRLPFGGVKASGPGREAGKYAIDFFTDLRTVYSKL